MLRKSRVFRLLFGCVVVLHACSGGEEGSLFGEMSGGTSSGGRAGAAPLGGSGALARGGTVSSNEGGAASAGGPAEAGEAGAFSVGAGGRSSGGGSAGRGGGILGKGGSVPASGGNGGSPRGGTAGNGGADETAGSGGVSNQGGNDSSAGSGGAGDDVYPLIQSGSNVVAAFTMSPQCTRLAFPNAFQVSGDEIQVQVTVVHPGAVARHNPIIAWAEGVSSTGFTACLSEDAGSLGAHARSRLDWVALAIPAAAELGMEAGRITIASGTTQACSSVQFAFARGASFVQARLRGSTSTEAVEERAAVWLEETSSTGFRLCVRALEGSEQVLDGTLVDWVAYPETLPPLGFVAGELTFPAFTGVGCQQIATNCANCENVQLSTNHRRLTEAAPGQIHDSTMVWAEDLTAAGILTVCVRETSAHDFAHDDHLSVDWWMRGAND